MKVDDRYIRADLLIISTTSTLSEHWPAMFSSASYCKRPTSLVARWNHHPPIQMERVGRARIPERGLSAGCERAHLAIASEQDLHR
jgi:hypothetical protein